MSKSLQEARRQGEIAAARELIRLGIDQTKPIDIFRIIRNEQLWLRFGSFDGPHGAYIPGGILINSNRSLRFQRLTAAHEYGHHVLKHSTSIDELENLGDPNKIKDIQEASAQAFATDFMMPIKLVRTQWSLLGLTTSIESWQAYLLALRLGISYQATIFQLIAQEQITLFQGEKLLKVQPKEVKSYIGGGIPPLNSHADVWLLNRSDSGIKITVSMNDEIKIDLPESPSTGYRWSLSTQGIQDESAADEYETHPFSLVRSEFEVVDTKLIREGTGGYGNRYITIRAVLPGRVKLNFKLQRPWGSQSHVDEFLLDLNVQAPESGFQKQIIEALAIK